MEVRVYNSFVKILSKRADMLQAKIVSLDS